MMLALLLSLATAQSDSPPPITVKLNHEQFSRGDHARVYVQAAQDGYLVVLHADGDGRVRVLFPLDPTDDAFVRGGRRQELRGRAGRDAFTVDVGDGAGTVLAAISSDPLTYDGFVLNDHWDYRALRGGTVSNDPLAGLLDIVRRMSGDKSFEYDAATYVVNREIADDGYDGYGYGHPRYRMGLSFGYPYGFGFNPFYDPFCYDPFWGCYGFGYRYRFGYGFGYSFYPRRPYTYGFGRPFFSGGFGNRDGTRFVIPNRPTRERFTPVQPRPRSGDIAPRSRSFGGDRTIAPRDRGGSERTFAPRDRGGSERTFAPRDRGGSERTFAPRDRGSRGSSGGRPSVGPRSGGGSRPAARPSGGGRRTGGGGGRRG